MEVKIPRKKGDIVQEIQRKKAHFKLDSDKKVQKAWKLYMKKTKGLSHLSKEQFYDVHLKNQKGK